MPLFKSKSKEAFKKNVKTEMDEGKPQAQSLAIAYNTQRSAKKKKMADGGEVKPEQYSADAALKEYDTQYMSKEEQDASMSKGKPSSDMYNPKKMAAGGEVSPSDLMSDDERADSIADAIMQKRRKMANGGMLEANAEEEPNQYYGMNEDAANEDIYDLDQLSARPQDSNETGDSAEDDSENKHDMVSAIRRKLRMKAGA